MMLALMSEPDLSDAIAQNAQNPKRASGDSGSVESQPLADQIAADRYLKSQDAVKNTKRRGLRFNRLIPPTTY